VTLSSIGMILVEIKLLQISIVLRSLFQQWYCTRVLEDVTTGETGWGELQDCATSYNCMWIHIVVISTGQD
jgi:hypothetical protein